MLQNMTPRSSHQMVILVGQAGVQSRHVSHQASTLMKHLLVFVDWLQETSTDCCHMPRPTLRAILLLCRV